MSNDLQKALQEAIKSEIGDLVSKEIKTRFEPLQKTVEGIREENRESYDQISKQIAEDRKDINQIKIDQAKGNAQNKVIIENQNLQEKVATETIKAEAEKIPKITQKAVESMFEKKAFLKKIKERFRR